MQMFLQKGCYLSTQNFYSLKNCNVEISCQVCIALLF